MKLKETYRKYDLNIMIALKKKFLINPANDALLLSTISVIDAKIVRMNKVDRYRI